MTCIKSNHIYTENGVANGYLQIENGRFKKILNKVDSKEKVFDYSDNIIIPGIFDTHNHGSLGYGLNGQCEEEIKKNIHGYLNALGSQGITSIFPTTTSPDIIKYIAQIAKEHKKGPEVMGIHSEGPWLNRVGEKGIRKPFPPMNIKIAEQMMNDGDGLLKLVALAPEIKGSSEVIRYFLEHGITVSIAHSDCNASQTRAAIDTGVSVATHLCNVMTGIHHRDVGILGTCLMDNRITAELICDGMHVCNDMLRFIISYKGTDKIMMISDCTQFAGAPAGVYDTHTDLGLIYVGKDGFVTTDTGRICGSSKPALYGMKNLVKNVGIPLEEAVKMSSSNPHMKYGSFDRKGSIKPGKDADFVIIDDNFNVLLTVANGEVIYNIKDGNLSNPEFVNNNGVK